MKYVFLMFLVIAVLNPIVARKSYKVYLFLAALCMSALAYFVIPTENMDLYRYINLSHLLSHMGWGWGMRHNGNENPLALAFFYLLGKIGNDNLIPAITVFIFYGCAFYIFYKASKKYNVSFMNMNIAFAFLVLNLNYCYLIDVVRLYVAYAVLAVFLYKDLAEKKHRPLCFAVYIALCYFHFVIIIFVLLRFAFIFLKKFKGVFMVIAFVAVPALTFAGYMIVSKLNLDSSLFNVIVGKVEDYQEYQLYGKWQSIESVIRIIIMLAIAALAIMLCNSAIKKYNRQDEKYSIAVHTEQYSVFVIYIMLTVFVFISNFQYVLRTPYLVQVLISVPLLYILGNYKSLKPDYSGLLKGLIIMESLMDFTYSLLTSYGNLSFDFTP